MENNEVVENYVNDKKTGTKKPLVISLSTLVTIVAFSSMLLFVLLLMFIETANML
ncbi:MAG: hypothetical protein IJW20_04955 [Clostridia bacterium]|nr:hypothetical protein [Clostridia bacterium]